MASLAGAATPDTHFMNAQLPDGLIARIHYPGDVPPRVVLAPRVGSNTVGDRGAPKGGATPAFQPPKPAPSADAKPIEVRGTPATKPYQELARHVDWRG